MDDLERLADAVVEDSGTANCGHWVEGTEVCETCGKCIECCAGHTMPLVFELIEDIDYPIRIGESITLKAGELCYYVPNIDSYVFEDRASIVPYFKRAYVEVKTELFRRREVVVLGDGKVVAVPGRDQLRKPEPTPEQWFE